MARINNIAGAKASSEEDAGTGSTLEEAVGSHSAHEEALRLHAEASRICHAALNEYELKQTPVKLCRELVAAEQARARLLLAAGRLDEAAGRNKQPPLATENLLENTGDVLRPPPSGMGRGSEHPISVLSGRHPATFYSC